MYEPVEQIPGDKLAPIVFTCEHASNAMVPPWSWPEEDQWLTEEHWAWDPGAADLTRELATHFDAPATLSRFSRLLVDPNRPLDSDTLFRAVADDRPIHLNQGLTEEDREARLDAFYRPYHKAVREMIEGSAAWLAFSVHSFTRFLGGDDRDLEVGVLWDQDDHLAARLVEALEYAGFVVFANQPYSGKLGFAWSIENHAEATGRIALELEVRQDLIVNPEVRRRLIRPIETILKQPPDRRRRR